MNQGFIKLKRLTEQVHLNRNTVYSMASHFAANLAKSGKLHTEVFFDLALITAISNDMGFDNVFAEPLRRWGKTGDLLVAINSSGNSPNIIEAIKIKWTNF